MKPAPRNWPRIPPALFYRDANAAIDWLCRAFGFEVRIKVEGDGGSVVHSELTYGDGLVMVYSADGDFKSPAELGGANTQALTVYVDDVDAHCARARLAGASIFRELADTHYSETWTDRVYGAKDPEGHHWWFSQRLG